MVDIEKSQSLAEEHIDDRDFSSTLSPDFLQEINSHWPDSIDINHVTDLFQDISREDQDQFWFLALQSFI